MKLADFSRYCGPAVLASAMCVSRLQAAQLIRDARRHLPRRGHGRGTTNIRELAWVLGKQWHGGHGYVPNGDGAGRPKARRTLAQWLKANPKANAIVLVAHHYVHVCDGQVIEDNGYRPMRGRVTHAIYL